MLDCAVFASRYSSSSGRSNSRSDSCVLGRLEEVCAASWGCGAKAEKPVAPCEVVGGFCGTEVVLVSGDLEAWNPVGCGGGGVPRVGAVAGVLAPDLRRCCWLVIVYVLRMCKGSR